MVANETMRRKRAVGLVKDPIKSAKVAGLRYVNDDKPGIRRELIHDEFRYFYPDNSPVTDPDELQRIRKLGIPRLIRMYGFAPYPTVICKPLDEMRVAASNIVITQLGERCETRLNTGGCWTLVRRYPWFASV